MWRQLLPSTLAVIGIVVLLGLAVRLAHRAETRRINRWYGRPGHDIDGWVRDIKATPSRLADHAPQLRLAQVGATSTNPPSTGR